MKDSVLQNKTYSFAIQVIQVYKVICKEQKEYVLSRQLLKSGTAIGALVREAEYAQSNADFISKMSIALKEANECEYWIRLLNDSEIISKESSGSLLSEIDEIIRILVSSIKTLKQNISR